MYVRPERRAGSRCKSKVQGVRSDAERVVGGENERPALWAFVWLRLLYASKYASAFPELGPPTALTAQCQSRSRSRQRGVGVKVKCSAQRATRNVRVVLELGSSPYT